MSAQNNYLPLEVRYYNLHEAQRGSSYRVIVKKVSEEFSRIIHRSTISSILTKFSREGTIDAGPTTGKL